MSEQPEELPDVPWFMDGEAYDPHEDYERLRSQLMHIFVFLRAHPWSTAEEIAKALGYLAQSVAAQIQHLRKEKYGAYEVTGRFRKGTRVYEYAITGGKGTGKPRLSRWHQRALELESELAVRTDELRIAERELDKLYAELGYTDKEGDEEQDGNEG